MKSLRQRRMGMGAAVIVGALFAATVSWAGPTVRVSQGVLEGAGTADVVSFKGIPFAAPPVGALRWRPPAPAASWTGTRDATKFGAICMQKLSKDNGVGPGPASEDCLTLNVFAPTGARKLPVMVWIHGGGLVNGSGTADLYDGAALARQGVVVVTINYRLGRLGFFAHPALTAEAGGHEPLANYGLMDQVAALEWVQREIAGFGGDPAQVTIFGESAGGISVNRLMMMKDARGLFVRAISESGVGRERSHDLKGAEADGVAFATKLGAPAADAKALRALSADAIIAAGDPDIFQGELPILDGVMLTEDPAPAFARGHVVPVPYLVGSNSLEIPGAFLGPRLEAVLKPFSADVRAVVAKTYDSEASFKDRVGSDIIFAEPARMLARTQATRAPTWLYRFSVLSAGAPKVLHGAVHASDRQYIFQTLNASPWPTDARDAALAKTISAYFVAFAKTGDPNGAGRPKWPAYGADDRLINFTNDGPMAMTTPDAASLDAIAAAAAP